MFWPEAEWQSAAGQTLAERHRTSIHSVEVLDSLVGWR
jgi:hypothetical protein